MTWLRLRNLTLRGLGAGVLCAQSLAHDVTQQPTPPRQNLTNGDVADDGDGRRSSFYRQTLDDLRQQYRAAADACKACRVPEVSSGNTLVVLLLSSIVERCQFNLSLQLELRLPGSMRDKVLADVSVIMALCGLPVVPLSGTDWFVAVPAVRSVQNAPVHVRVAGTLRVDVAAALHPARRLRDR